MIGNRLSTQNVVKSLCKGLKYTAVGDFWHENKSESMYYKFFQYIMFTIFYLVMTFEWLELVYKDYPTDLHNDAVSCTVSHVIILSRINILIYHKKHVKSFIYDVVEACRGYEKSNTLREQRKKVNLGITLQIITFALTMIFFFLEAIRRTYRDDEPFVVMVTYYPRYENVSYSATAMRIFVLIVHLVIMACKIATDSLVSGLLVLISFKFVTLRQYFDGLPDAYETKSRTMSKDRLRKWLKEQCAEGIRMHRELIRLSNVLYDLFWAIMSIQVCQCCIIIILILLRITLASHIKVTAIVMSFGYIASLLTQLALYLWNAGEITYQASLISTSIFHCGWHLCGMKENHKQNDMRCLVLMGCLQAQRPIVIKAFGIFDLSYEAFVTVVRATYSLFAVLN